MTVARSRFSTRAELEARCHEMRRDGASYTAIERDTGASFGTIHRILEETIYEADHASATPEREVLSAEAHASDVLLRRLLGYGLRHDGLPGLPYDRLVTLARDRGLVA